MAMTWKDLGEMSLLIFMDDSERRREGWWCTNYLKDSLKVCWKTSLLSSSDAFKRFLQVISRYFTFKLVFQALLVQK